LFFMRQRLQPDNGFLAVSLFTIGRLFGLSEPKETAVLPEDDSGTEDLTAPETPPPAPPPGHPFWRPVAARLGPAALEGAGAVLKVISVFFLVSIFWALFDQHSSTWIQQANMMNLTVWGDTKAEASQIPALNPLLVMILIPLLNVVYAGVDRTGIKTTPLRRMTVGMFISALSFAVVAVYQNWIDYLGAGVVSFLWQVIPYLLLTVGEVMVSVTGLEFAYTQAPKTMKSTVMSFWNL